MQPFTRLMANSRIRKRRFARWRMPMMLALSIVALVLLMWMHPQRASTPFPWPTQRSLSGSGRGAGGVATSAHISTAPAFCLPTDVNCTVSSIASWAASQIQAAFQPIGDAILTNPADIIYQTPLLTDDTSPQNKAIIALNTFFVEVVDLAFACLLVIAGYNAIVGRHVNMPHTSLLEALPRAVLVVAAVHFNLLFTSLFVSFENALTLDIIHIAGLRMLTNLIAGLFSIKSSGLIAFVLLVVLGIMVIMLLIQMITRIALVAISLALAPLGLGCFLLPQTMRWGRLWLVTPSSSVLVQFVQVVTIGLGGVFITAIAATSFVRIDTELATALLAIGTMGLVLKIPGMLQTWALHPMMDNGGGGGSGAEGGSGSGASSTPASGGASDGGSSGAAATGGSAMEGTIVTEESGALLLLF